MEALAVLVGVELAAGQPLGQDLLGTGRWLLALLVGLAGAPEQGDGNHVAGMVRQARRPVGRPGSPLANGVALQADGSTSGSATQLNGYSVIQAEDSNQALGLVQDHPYLAQGPGYSIETYRLP